MSDFDLIVIGTGPGGYVAAIRAAQLGLKTAVVEREELGGICLNWGCIPTKALLRSSEVFHLMTHAEGFGLGCDNPRFDLAKVVERSRGVSGQLTRGVQFLMKKNKIEVLKGEGRLEPGDPAPTVVVASPKGEEKRHTAKHGVSVRELIDEAREANARRLLADPPGMMAALCTALDIAFDPAMLSWPVGRRDSDGVWAPHWYDAVERSTGFTPPPPPTALTDARLQEIARQARPHYEQLAAHALATHGVKQRLGANVLT